MLPYHETVKKIGNPKVTSHEKRKLLQKAHVGEGVIESVTIYLEWANKGRKILIDSFSEGTLAL